MLFLSYLILGACAGLLAGLFGIGGGLIIVPVLVISFKMQGMAPEILTHVAVGTSLATIIVTSLSSVRTHHRKRGVRWELFGPLAVGICLGAILGVKTAGRLSGPMLQTVIGCFALLVAAQMTFGFQPKGNHDLPGKTGLSAAGGFIGWASAIFGIGGGTLTVPFLSWNRVRIQEAIGTSAACGLPIAVMGALTNIQEGWGHPQLMEWSLGYVYLPAFLGIILTSAYFAKLGALLAHKLSPQVLRRVFSLLLLAVGLRFLLAN